MSLGIFTPTIAGTPMIPDSLPQWLYTNAPAAWISAVVAVVTCVYVLWSRKKPRRLLVRYLASSSLVRVWPSVKKKIDIRFDGQAIRTLTQVDLEIMNEGSEAIASAGFTITLPPKSRILDILVTPQEFKTSATYDDRVVSMSLPYINPFRDHKQVCVVSILADGSMYPLEVRGGGEGWSVRHIPRPTQRRVKYVFALFVLTMLVLVASLFYYLSYLEEAYGIRQSEISLRALKAFIPAGVVIVCVMSMFWLWATRSLGFMKLPRDLAETAEPAETRRDA